MAEEERVEPGERRARGEGSVYVNPHGIVCVQIRDHGERKRYSTKKRGAAGFRAAEKLLARKTEKVEHGTFAPQADQLRLRDLENLLIKKQEASGRDTVHARASFRRLHEHFRFRRAIDIPKGMDEYIDEGLSAGVGRGTIRRDIACLRRALNLAALRGLIPYQLKVPTTPPAPPRSGFVDEAGWARIETALKRHPHLQAFCSFLFLSGWRKGRAQRLRWSEVDLDRGEIVLEDPSPENKATPAVLPFGGTRLEAIIRAQWAVTQARQRALKVVIPTVFWRPVRTGVKPIRDFRGAWETAVKAAGRPGLLIHDLRRSRARLWNQAGVPDRLGMALGGWRTVSTYHRYRIVSSDDRAGALQQADAYAAALKSKADRAGARKEREAG